jgi:hypothetical protein
MARAILTRFFVELKNSIKSQEASGHEILRIPPNI